VLYIGEHEELGFSSQKAHPKISLKVISQQLGSTDFLFIKIFF